MNAGAAMISPPPDTPSAPAYAPADVDWLIVGGGIHGVHLAVCLLAEAGVAPARIAIVDPAPKLLARWRAVTAVTGMRHLRSPSVHHLDHEPFSLRRFAARRENQHLGGYAPPYDRPSLAMFDAHSRHVIATYGVDALHVRDRVERCEVARDGVVVTLASGRDMRAQRVILAMGASEQPDHPAWAPRGDARVQHVFDPRFGDLPTGRETVGVVGGGISAAQVALRMADGGQHVTLFTRHDLREQQFDSDPGWLGPKNMARFESTRDPERRRAMIDEGRHRGSMPREVRIALRRAVERGAVTLRRGDVRDLAERDGTLRLDLSTGREVAVDHLLLATGFTTQRPGGPLVDDLIRTASLPCAPCGYPLVDGALRWHPRIHVSGPLAELELGPVSRNIAGAQRAGERILAMLAKAARPEALAV